MQPARSRGRAGCVVLALVLVIVGCGDSGAGPDPAPRDWAQPAKPVTCPERDDSPNPESTPAPDPFDARSLMGLSEKDAEARAREHDCSLRVVSEDGEGGGLTGDHYSTRINVYIDDGRVVGVQVF